MLRISICIFLVLRNLRHHWNCHVPNQMDSTNNLYEPLVLHIQSSKWVKLALTENLPLKKSQMDMCNLPTIYFSWNNYIMSVVICWNNDKWFKLCFCFFQKPNGSLHNHVISIGSNIYPIFLVLRTTTSSDKMALHQGSLLLRSELLWASLPLSFWVNVLIQELVGLRQKTEAKNIPVLKTSSVITTKLVTDYKTYSRQLCSMYMECRHCVAVTTHSSGITHSIGEHFRLYMDVYA